MTRCFIYNRKATDPRYRKNVTTYLQRTYVRTNLEAHVWTLDTKA